MLPLYICLAQISILHVCVAQIFDLFFTKNDPLKYKKFNRVIGICLEIKLTTISCTKKILKFDKKNSYTLQLQFLNLLKAYSNFFKAKFIFIHHF